MTIELPTTRGVPAARTYFADEPAWIQISAELTAPGDAAYVANLEFITLPQLAGMGAGAVDAAVSKRYPDGS